MPEYLAPGVYVEEVSFRSKSIEGVSTSVAGFIGPTRYGPTEGPPELLTSFSDFERIYGGMDSIDFGNEPQPNFMAHAVRAFFDNGGSKLYVTRVYQHSSDESQAGIASLDLSTTSLPTLSLHARFPGQAGNMRITFAMRTSPNLLADNPKRLSSVRENDVVFVKRGTGSISSEDYLFDVILDNGQLAFKGRNTTVKLDDLDPKGGPEGDQVFRITLSISVRRPGRFEDDQVWTDLSPHPKARNAVTALFTETPDSRQKYLTIPFAIQPRERLESGAELLERLFGTDFINDKLLPSLQTDEELENQSLQTIRPRPSDLQVTRTLENGSDGNLPTPDAYKGREMARSDASSGEVRLSTGLETFVDIEEISMIAAPGHSFNYKDSNQGSIDQIVQYLITHCERMRYRVAILDSPNDQVLSEIQEFRGKLDSKYAALYYPWIKIIDPLDPDGRREIFVPPSGFVAGICARTDVLHGVFKAPANEITLGGIGFEQLLNKAQQDILNPLGINCFRYFEGRGFRLWGARTISSDPEWKYFSVRRYFAYLERSIDKGTQWAVFENNSESLWTNLRNTITDFLVNEWRNGALMGTKPEEAFFVRCDRSTMTQNDLDNGRLVCLIGVAVVKPAEFVIFRIGQFTADRK
ncbi:phage tail sheath family protein [Nitrosomonas nitrosa]|uniref:phage tail sheath family protein n=1 Tax=Nitrosomonas nitrosa TaxID=52442 RepID=UPI0023F65A62|nr:phage tail sheath subtilisin-like domain-containing protein [Nitrosomonas nitrosa]MCO6434999.1 phage tail sheath family protein [Nitrosomonas nitrosa]